MKGSMNWRCEMIEDERTGWVLAGAVVRAWALVAGAVALVVWGIWKLIAWLT